MRNTTRIASAVLGAVVALGLTACSSTTDGSGSGGQGAPGTASQPVGDPSSAIAPPPPQTSSAAPAAKDIDPCSLVTRAEADKVAGVHVQKPVRSLELCTFPTPTTGSVGQLEVYVGDGVKKYYDIDKINLGHKFHDVADLGDEAHAEDGAIFVKMGDLWFGLRVTRLDETDTDPLLVDLAHTVAGRI